MEAGAHGSAPLLEVTDLVKHFPIKRGILIDREVDQVRAVDGISFEVGRAKPWAWSASRAAASRLPAAPSCS
jgi:ABC-type glutathione transport system ATPase component